MSEDPFVTHRSLLFTVAYEMLGSAADAEDVVQETWLRWADVDQDEVHDSRAYLVRSVTRRALDRLRTVRRRREEYMGEWLPEPLRTTADVAADIELAESLSIAMLRVLESLGATERAVFVLREVFDTPYKEIAQAVDKSPAAVRQIARRARDHVAARRPRKPVSRAEQEAAVEAFRAAVEVGDLQRLMDLLAPEVILIADGGGMVPALSRPVSGDVRVGRVLAELIGRLAREAPHARVQAAWLNGAPALGVEIAGKVDAVVSLELGGGQITGIYAIRNPDKLTRLGEVVHLSRTS